MSSEVPAYLQFAETENATCVPETTSEVPSYVTGCEGDAAGSPGAFPALADESNLAPPPTLEKAPSAVEMREHDIQEQPRNVTKSSPGKSWRNYDQWACFVCPKTYSDNLFWWFILCCCCCGCWLCFCCEFMFNYFAKALSCNPCCYYPELCCLCWCDCENNKPECLACAECGACLCLTDNRGDCGCVECCELCWDCAECIDALGSCCSGMGDCFSAICEGMEGCCEVLCACGEVLGDCASILN